MTVPLLSQHPEDLGRLLRGTGRARMVFARLAEGLNPMNDPCLSPKLRKQLRETVHWPDLREIAQRPSADGTVKMLLQCSGHSIEAVLIPTARRTTLCISSQVGCARGCGFCMTATMGLVAQLSTEAIVAQVHHGLRVAKAHAMAPLRNLVFMGMGEPLDNWTAVQPAIATLTADRGFAFAPRHVTVSTVAPSPASVGKLTGCPTRIAWSLHAARDEVRKRIVPTQRHSVGELVDAFKAVFSRRKDPIFVEMTLIDGVNDHVSDAAAAVELLGTFPTEVRFNLLPVNPTARGWMPSPPDKVQAFGDILRAAGYFTKVRTARGQDQDAACGQLATIGASFAPASSA